MRDARTPRRQIALVVPLAERLEEELGGAGWIRNYRVIREELASHFTNLACSTQNPPVTRNSAPEGLPGADIPDHRGRTNLHLTGRDLTGNPNVRIEDVELVATGWHVLRRTILDYRGADGQWSRQSRETYDRGNGATILLYDVERRTVLLTRQFRFPVYVNGHPDGMLIETAAGLLDEDDPLTAVRREAEEELGVTVGEAEHIYAAPYTPADRTSAGGGVDKGEQIEIVELPFVEALQQIEDGGIADAKTIMLLQWAALRGPFRVA
jgi:8-oxo-dGTP pyrophosphatase MutT (NUDIX family)